MTKNNINSSDTLDVSIVLPTYNEAQNIPLMVPKICNVLNQAKIKGEIIVVDDNSPDKTGEVAQKLAAEYPVQVIVRQNERGLATAVLEGFRKSKATVCVVMDADGSHPVDTLPDMITPILKNQYEATIGTRYIEGGATDNWPLIRRIISKTAGFITLGLTKMKDSTSGFMAIKRSKIENQKFQPIGWKIVLEIMVRVNPSFLEVPITFQDRQHGESKLSFKEQINYLRHLEKLYEFKYQTVVEFLRFCFVGLVGLVIDLSIIYLLKSFVGLNLLLCNIIGFSVALTNNYFMNRHWSFVHGKQAHLVRGFLAFFLVCILGLLARLGVVYTLQEHTFLGAKDSFLIISFIGILVASVFNFVGSKIAVFRSK
jgi:dolichol-phosphate mannosyltransferase